ncbi:family 16 glycoside hydrolase [Ktedonospora formicarum]|nr:family 16 glycoside hydrolase [Ktedonospora formicarum]
MRGDLTTCTAQGINLTNFALQVEVAQIQGQSAGLLFYIQDTFSAFYAFQIDKGGSYQLTVYTDNTRSGARIILRNTSSAIKTAPEDNNVLGLRAHNGRFDLYINGFYIQSATDNTYTKGYLGLFVDAQYDASTEAVFKNLKIWVE